MTERGEFTERVPVGRIETISEEVVLKELNVMANDMFGEYGVDPIASLGPLLSLEAAKTGDATLRRAGMIRTDEGRVIDFASPTPGDAGENGSFSVLDLPAARAAAQSRIGFTDRAKFDFSAFVGGFSEIGAIFGKKFQEAIARGFIPIQYKTKWVFLDTSFMNFVSPEMAMTIGDQLRDIDKI